MEINVYAKLITESLSVLLNAHSKTLSNPMDTFFEKRTKNNLFNF